MAVGAHLPYGLWWSTPFARWQGSLASLHALRLAAHVARGKLADWGLKPELFDLGILGTTVPQKGGFHGLTWLMGQIGAEAVAGPTVAQACATGTRMLAMAADEIARGDARVVLAVAADRVSNGPQIHYPDPSGPGGAGEHESWVLDNVAADPFAGVSMVQTAENVAVAAGVDRAAQDELTLCRYAQYTRALADDSAFLRRFMALPFDVPDPRFRTVAAQLPGDEGIHATTAEGLARLRPVLPGGTFTHGGQTHPADGNAGIVVTSADRATELSRDPRIAVRLVAFGQARVERAHMPMAPVLAAGRALTAAGLDIRQLAAIKTHNPFIVNDLYFARSLGIDPAEMNNFGCSLVWGHPQGPTGLRAVIELIEELALRSGGYGLFTGCAAGDSAMAAIVHVGDSAQ